MPEICILINNINSWAIHGQSKPEYVVICHMGWPHKLRHRTSTYSCSKSFPLLSGNTLDETAPKEGTPPTSSTYRRTGRKDRQKSKLQIPATEELKVERHRIP